MARVKRRFSDRGKITRTLKLTEFDVTYFDRETKELKTVHKQLIGALTEKEMLASVSDAGIGVQVANVIESDALYVCELSEFLKVATKVENDSNN